MRFRGKLVLCLFVCACAKATTLTPRGRLVKVADAKQSTTFTLNDHCKQAVATLDFKDIEDARNLAGLNGYNVVQPIFQDAYDYSGQARMWQCPEGYP